MPDASVGTDIINSQKGLKDKNPNNLKIEHAIVLKFYNTNIPLTSIILLKNEILKAYNFAQKISTLAKNNKKLTDLSIILTETEKHFKTKLPSYYIKFLLKIVKEYFKTKIPEDKREMCLFWAKT